MNVEEAKLRWEKAERELRGCEAHLNRANRDWRDAEASGGSNERYYRLQRTHGIDYMKKFKDAWEDALREFHRAREQEEKARADYEKAKDDEGRGDP